MAVYFFDTSALVKRYLTEVGSAWVSGLTDPTAGHLIYVSRLTAVEIVSAVVRRQRGGLLPAADCAPIVSELRQHLAQQYRVEHVVPHLLDDAMSLAESHFLRAGDAVQLATVLALPPISGRKELS